MQKLRWRRLVGAYDSMVLWYLDYDLDKLIKWYSISINRGSALSNINYSIGNGEGVRLHGEETGNFTCMLTMADGCASVAVF